MKPNPPPHPLVRSKSAVVRSLYRKMRTPFTRSHTVDENLLRYYSPDTSEYTVSEGYMLKPEILNGKSNKRIPEIYVEDCLQVNFNDRLLNKFQNASTSYATPYTLKAIKKPTTASLSSRLRPGWKEPLSNSIVSRSRPFDSGTTGFTDYELRNLETRSHPRRSLLFAKAKSFDYNVVNDPCVGGFATGSLRDTGCLSRRAKSFEYESMSSNIFSDDSLRTARRKLKRNMSISDSKYGDKIPALRDRSKSYYDSNGDNGSRKTLNSKAQLIYEGDQDNVKTFYGYDSELSAGETEIYVPSADSFIDSNNFTSLDSRVPSLGLGSMSTVNDVRSSVLCREDIGKRKYKEFDYRSPEKRAKSLENDIYGRLDNNDHIYCSIDEIILPEDPCKCRILNSSRLHRTNYDSPMHRTTISGLSEIDDSATRRRVRSRRRAKSTDSYLEDDYERYENWEAEYASDYPDTEALGDSRIPSLEIDEYYDVCRNDTCIQKLQNSQLHDYGGYHESGSYADESLSYMGHDEIDRENYDDTSTRRGRRRDPAELVSIGDYENLKVCEDYASNRKNSLTVPSFSESKKMMIGRAESTPILIHDEDYGVSEERTARRMSRRRRNSSCPESRDIVMTDDTMRRSESTGFYVDSDEDFGSMETVVGPNYVQKTTLKDSYVFGTSKSRYAEEKCMDSDCPELIDYRASRIERSGSFSGMTRQRSDGDTGGHDYRRRKSSCPECREISSADRSGILTTRDRNGDESLRTDEIDGRYRYRRRRNSSCPEARDIELYDEETRRMRHDDRLDYQQQQGSKRNVAISDTLEYYEYSMESESQCSENCGFGPYDPLRPRNRAAPRPGNANSNIFDSQKTATSDTAKNPRAIDDHHHDITKRRNHAKQRADDDYDETTSSKNLDTANDDVTKNRQRRSQRTKYDDDHDDDGNERRSTSIPESSEYASQSSSYEKNTRHPVSGNSHNGHAKRGQFTRSLSNADVPPDEKVGE